MDGSPSGLRQFHLVKSFKLAVRCLLTSCNKEEFFKEFSGFRITEKESLHRLFIQVIASLHKKIEDEFESLCVETQVGTILDKVEQLVEEENLDPLFSEKSNIMDVVHDLSLAKKDEVSLLMDLMKKAEEEKCLITKRIELLKAERLDASYADVFAKLKSGALSDESL